MNGASAAAVTRHSVFVVPSVLIGTKTITNDESALVSDQISVSGNGSTAELLPSLTTAEKVGELMIRFGTNVAIFFLAGSSNSVSEYHDSDAVWGSASGSDTFNIYWNGAQYVIENNAGGGRTFNMWLIS